LVFSRTVTVLSPLEYVGISARLSAWSIFGLTPLWVQYSGRHDSYEKELVL
jgi:hypothetical protein